jgi:hypothetical protein
MQPPTVLTGRSDDVVFHVGDVVQATSLITEADGDPDPDAKPCREGWVHATPGALGVVETVDAFGIPTVRFFDTHTSTIVFSREVRRVAAIGLGRRASPDAPPDLVVILRLEDREVAATVVLAIHGPGRIEH